jgi:hypothetical protein
MASRSGTSHFRIRLRLPEIPFFTLDTSPNAHLAVWQIAILSSGFDRDLSLGAPEACALPMIGEQEITEDYEHQHR